MNKEYGVCCGIPVDERTGKCRHRDNHPRHVTQPMMKEMWTIFRLARRARRDPLQEVLEELFARDAEAQGYEPAPGMPQKPAGSRVRPY